MIGLQVSCTFTKAPADNYVLVVSFHG